MLGVARLAAIQAAKRTAELIPLAHPLALTRVAVEFELEKTALRLIASVERLPFADRDFDVVVAGFVIRNVGDIPRALGEMHRVLRPGGRAVILDLHTPRNPTIRRLYRAFSLLSPRLAGALGSDPEAYRYLPRSIEAFHDPEALAALLRNAGFARVRFERLTFGIAAIHVGEA